MLKVVGAILAIVMIMASSSAVAVAQEIDTFLVKDSIYVEGFPFGCDGYGDYLWFVDLFTSTGYRVDLKGNIISSSPVPQASHASAFYVDADYVYYGPYFYLPSIPGWTYSIVKYDWSWNPVDTLHVPPIPDYSRSEDLGFDGARWWIAQRYGDVYSWVPPETTLTFEFHHNVTVTGDHVDGLEVVGQWVYLSEMFTDTIYQYDKDGNCAVKYVYAGGGAGTVLEGMGFGPRGDFWYSGGPWDGWFPEHGYLYQLGGIRVSVQIAISPDTVIVEPGETANFTIFIMNIGSEEDSYVMGLSGLPEDFIYSLADTVWNVPALDTFELSLGITPPSDLAIWVDTPYLFVVACTSLTDPEVSHTTTGTVVILAQATPGSRVRFTDELLDSLIAQVEGAEIQAGVKNSLLSELYNAERKKEQGLERLEAGDTTVATNMFNAAANMLGAFINEVEAQRGKKITEDDADSFIAQAEDIIWRLEEGIWEETPPSPKIAEENSQTPSGVWLHQNYPNPFNPVTQISYTLPRDGHVKLEIYNLLGQKVATLVDEYQEAGQKTVNWEAKDFSSGIYFYKLSASDFTATKKMVLTK